MKWFVGKLCRFEELVYDSPNSPKTFWQASTVLLEPAGWIEADEPFLVLAVENVNMLWRVHVIAETIMGVFTMNAGDYQRLVLAS